jgi:two-component system, sensor histidine kinase and response regulator
VPLATLPGEWHCLVLDPHFAYGDYLSRQISQWGLPASFVPTPEGLPAQLAATPVNSLLIITGYDERSNPGFTAQLRTALAGRATRTILHLQTNTGGSGAELDKQIYQAFVPKPLRSAQLSRSIVGLLGGPVAAQDFAGTTTRPGLPAAANSLLLVVEDNLLNQKVILKMLGNLGYQYELAENGAQAVDLAAKKHYDLILMDWHMPVMDGLEATKRIRQLGDQQASLPIIALTASALQNEREQCFVAGMNDYLSKPVTEKNLKATLHKWLAAGTSIPPP